MKRLVVFLLLTSPFTLHTSVFGQWSLDPSVNTPVCVDKPFPRDFVRAVTDGAHGAYIVWLDARSFGTVEKTRVYAQHLDSAGIARWEPDGKLLNDTLNNAGIPSMLSDDSGGCIICCSVARYGIENGLYTQLIRLHPDGTRKWETRIWNKTLRFNNLPKLGTDGKGGVFVASTLQSGDYHHIYVQRISAAGTPLWKNDGVKVASWSHKIDYNLVSDDSGGAYIAWRDLREYGVGVHDTDIYVQRIDGDGNLLWPAEGVSVKRKTGPQNTMSLAGFGPAGVCILFRNQSYPPLNHAPDTLIMQLISPAGSRMWGEGGISLLEGGISGESVQRLDGSHLAVMFTDVAAGIGMIQKVNAWGTMVWNGGIPVLLGNDTHTQALLPDGQGGAFLAYYSWAGMMSQNLYLQCVSRDGALRWNFNERLICSAPGKHVMISSNVFSTGDIADRGLVAAGSGGVIAVWCDTRYSYQGPYEDFDIFAARFDANGIPLPIELLSFTATLAVSEVCLRWQTESETDNQGFTVQRSLNGSTWQDIGFVLGRGTTTEPQSYNFSDALPRELIASPAIRYRLSQQDYDGSVEYSPVASVYPSSAPAGIALRIYPNPVAAEASLSLTAPKDGYYSITLSDNLGRTVRTVYEGGIPRGNAVFPVNVDGLTSGTYIVRALGAGAAGMKSIIVP